MRQITLVIVLAAVAAFLAGGSPAYAAGFMVTTSFPDADDYSLADPTCDITPPGNPVVCTLRAAIMQADAHAGADTIDLPSSYSPYVLDGTKGELVITSPDGLTITGSPGSAVIQGTSIPSSGYGDLPPENCTT